MWILHLKQSLKFPRKKSLEKVVEAESKKQRTKNGTSNCSISETYNWK